ncbi:MAG TPA: outer membrane lipoprotein carrier protein LolA [Cyclobacteriaceae bacterium]|jgi:outer membrane lipoprotein-sorting protein
MRSLILFLWLAPLNLLAQYNNFTEISDISGFKKKFNDESAKIKSISSNFEQEKELTILSEKIISKGEFRFKRENKIRIEYLDPFYYLMIINGDKMIIKDDQNETTMNVRSNKLFQQVNNIMVESVNGTIIDNEDFSVRIFEDASRYLMEMTPVDKTLKGFFNTILIYADKESFSVTQILMNESSGDTTLIKFVNRNLNAQLSDEIFTLN